MESKRNPEEFEIDLLELLVLLKRHVAWILLAAVLCGALGFAVTKYAIKPTYKAGAKLLVNTRADVKATVTNDQINSATNLVDVYAIIIRSRSVLDPIISELDLKTDYETLSQQVSVASVNRTPVFEITVTDHNLTRAEKIVTAIVEASPKLIMDLVEAGSVKVIEAPYRYEGAVSPSLSKNLAFSVFIGVMLAVAVIFIKHFMDNTYKTDQQVREELDWPVLGVIPVFESTAAAKGRARKKREVDV